jgi:galactosylceramidase
MKNNLIFTVLVALMNFIPGYSQSNFIKITDNSDGRVFEGIGALSAGASSKLLSDYPVEIRDQILDLLFKPKFGASLQHLKVEIGGDVNSTDGTEPSHAHTRNEFLNPKPAYFQRGYEWLLLKEAKKRNPEIFTDCLQWGCPGWIGDGIFYSQDNADYIVSFLKGAKKYHGIDFDFTGIWNERSYNIEWIKLLRRTLDKNGLNEVKIIAADVFDWGIATDMQNDKELNDAVYAMGIHYNERWGKDPYSSSEVAKSLNKSIRNSEGGPWKGDWDGFEYLVKLYNRNYIVGKSTNVITWSLITSYYDNLSIPNSGLMTAKTPWSGHYEVQPAIWAAAHTTQFVEPGWKYVDSGCGFLKKGSYVTLKSPDEKDFSIIIETVDTTGMQTISFQLDQKFADKTLHVWKSTREKCEFEKQPDLKVRNNTFTIRLDGKSACSITTTTGQTKGNYQVPEAKPFPFPYKTDFEKETIGQLPKYFMDQAGVFEVHPRQDGKGNCLKQGINQQGIEWEVGQNVFVSTILGDVTWTDYEVQTDVNIQENTGYAKLTGRITEVRRGGDYPDGYWFKINTSGNWVLFAGEQKIGSGAVPFSPFTWHHLCMKFRGNTITVTVNDIEVVKVTDSKYKSGLAGIGSEFNTVEFDNFEVK